MIEYGYTDEDMKSVAASMAFLDKVGSLDGFKQAKPDTQIQIVIRWALEELTWGRQGRANAILDWYHNYLTTS